MSGSTPETAVVGELPDFLWVDDEESPEDVAVEERPSTPIEAPGEIGLWVFVLGDMSIFGLFFLVFLVEARLDRAGFTEASRELVVAVGVVNTLVLVTSSYLVVLGVQAHRRAATERAARLVLGALACGAAFATLKVVEYSLEVSAGNTPLSSLFFTFYFVLTGIHLVHVVIGSVLLARWRHRAVAGMPWSRTRGFAEGSAVYWHMVDLLWIVIFTLVYLVARA